MDGFVAGIDTGGPEKGFHLAAWRCGSPDTECLLHCRTPEQAAAWLHALEEHFAGPCLAVAVDGPPAAARPAGTPVRPAELAVRRLGYRVLWTPPADRPPAPWMVQSSRLHRLLRETLPRAAVLESFPTLNSDRVLASEHRLPIRLLQNRSRRRFRNDYLDAVLCGLTAEAYLEEQAAVYGSGDPLGVLHALPEPAQREYSLAFVCDGSRVLLGEKLRGFGQGYWNGFGGKVEPGETVHEAMCREVAEECGLQVLDAEPAGGLCFLFDGDPLWMRVHLFRVNRWEGTPAVSEEMRPAWFERDRLPLDKMWADDRFWLPAFLDGASVEGEFFFADLTRLHRWSVTLS